MQQCDANQLCSVSVGKRERIRELERDTDLSKQSYAENSKAVDCLPEMHLRVE